MGIFKRKSGREKDPLEPQLNELRQSIVDELPGVTVDNGMAQGGREIVYFAGALLGTVFTTMLLLGLAFFNLVSGSMVMGSVFTAHVPILAWDAPAALFATLLSAAMGGVQLFTWRSILLGSHKNSSKTFFMWLLMAAITVINALISFGWIQTVTTGRAPLSLMSPDMPLMVWVTSILCFAFAMFDAFLLVHVFKLIDPRTKNHKEAYGLYNNPVMHFMEKPLRKLIGVLQSVNGIVLGIGSLVLLDFVFGGSGLQLMFENQARVHHLHVSSLVVGIGCFFFSGCLTGLKLLTWGYFLNRRGKDWIANLIGAALIVATVADVLFNLQCVGYLVHGQIFDGILPPHPELMDWLLYVGTAILTCIDAYVVSSSFKEDLSVRKLADETVEAKLKAIEAEMEAEHASAQDSDNIAETGTIASAEMDFTPHGGN